MFAIIFETQVGDDLPGKFGGIDSAMKTLPVKSKDQKKAMAAPAGQPNRLQDVWVWDGRPEWDEIFSTLREQRQHKDIGCCYCGPGAVGAILGTMCRKYSSSNEDCLFSLHKENF